jgi:hypothetical protein
MNAPVERTHDGECEYGDVCPKCGEQGFDGRGEVLVEGTWMYLRGCWNCGTEFASEVRAGGGQ